MLKLFSYIILFISFHGIAQQDAIYSQYMFNPFAINPAYAGSRNAVNVVLLNRNQWLGLDGAPTTQTVSAHVPMNGKNLAWGVQFSHDQLGPTNNLLALATTAYRLKLETGTLHFGLRGGIYNSIFDQTKLNFREENDLVDVQQKVSAIVPTFDFGIYYYTDKFYGGLAINHLTEHQLNYNDALENQNYFLSRHFFVNAGYVFMTNSKFLIKPSVLVKYAGPSTLNFDFNINMLFNERFWIGLGIRNTSSANLLVDVNVTDYLRIGYSFDMNMTKLNHYSYGSHEFLIGFDFNLQKSPVISPRYL